MLIRTGARLGTALILAAGLCGCAESSTARSGGLLDAGADVSDGGVDDADAGPEAEAGSDAEGGAGDASTDANDCGNGVLDPGEACDGFDFGGLTCQSIGLGDGALQCNSTCGVVVTGCGAVEECNNGFDDDFDFATDCDDAECVDAIHCKDACASPSVVGPVPAFEFDSTDGKPKTLAPSCTAISGPEAVFRFTPTVSEELAFVASGDDDVSLSIRTVCNDVQSEIACVDEASASFADEVITLTVTAGTEYFVIVDALSTTGFFDLSIRTPPTETDCRDLADDDNDGAVDCDDSECTGNPDCVPGSKPVGAQCFSNTECASGQSDPVCLTPSLGYAGGYCSEFCTVGSNECAGDAECVDIGLSTSGVCLDGCGPAPMPDAGADAGASDAAVDVATDSGGAASDAASDASDAAPPDAGSAECRAGYICADRGAPRDVCTPPVEADCENFADDDSDGDIDCADSDCQGRAECMTGTTALGEACTQASDCVASNGDPVCLSESFWGFPGGYCSEHCSFDCGTDGVCIPYLSGGAEVCFKLCTTGTDCRAGYSCTPVSSFDSACTP